jgi:hypothetical protein
MGPDYEVPVPPELQELGWEDVESRIKIMGRKER